MKKFVPIFIILICILGVLSTQVKVEMSSSKAEPGSNSEAARTFYEAKFQSLKLKDLQGESFELKSIQTPVVVINFWASWCTPCLKEFPSIKKLVEQIGKNKVSVFAINADDKNVVRAVKDVKKIIRIKELPFNFVKDSGKDKIVDQFKVLTLPVSFVYVNGKLIKNQRGEFDFASDDFVKLVRSKIK